MFNLLMMKILVCFYFHYKNKYTYLSSSLAKCTVQNSRMSWRWASRIKDLTSENTCLYVILTNSSSITIMVDWVYSPGIYTALTELVRTGENDLRPTLHTDTALILIILLPHPEKIKWTSATTHSDYDWEREREATYTNIFLTRLEELKRFIKISNTCPSNITLAQMLLGKLLRCPFSSSMAFKFATWSEISLYNTMYCFRFSRLRDSTRLIVVFTWRKKNTIIIISYKLTSFPSNWKLDPKFYVWSLFCPHRDSKNCWMFTMIYRNITHFTCTNSRY